MAFLSPPTGLLVDQIMGGGGTEGLSLKGGRPSAQTPLFSLRLAIFLFYRAAITPQSLAFF